MIGAGIYIVGSTKQVIEFNDYNYAENMNLKLLDYNGNTIIDNVQQVYLKNYSISNEKTGNYSLKYSNFLNSLKVMKYDFIGDRFYE